MGVRTIDVDQHLFEARDTWSAHIDPAYRDDALSIVDDEHGWPWLVHRGRRLYPVEIQHPARPEEVAENRRRMRRGEPAPGRYEDLLPDAYGGGAPRAAALDSFGLDASVLFPNFGLIWERMLAGDRPARRANARAYNRWMAGALDGGGGRLFGVAHLLLDDVDWAVDEIARLAGDGVRLAMVAPAPVDGLPLSDRSLDPVWAAFCTHGVAPVFHVAGFESPLHEAWHRGDPEPGDRLMDSVFLWVAPAVALANLILYGTLERFPGLRIGVVELSAGWVPGFLLNLDGASDFYAARHGEPVHPLAERPSTYFLRQVKVAALPYEAPAYLVRKVGAGTFMVGSDWPHAEGVASPGTDSAAAVAALSDDDRAALLGANAAWLLGL
ncbi:MAG: amidohydrolase family protein [Acidimicrobiales bacterium]